MAPRLSDRVRARLREKLEVRKLSQRKLAALLAKETNALWNQMDVSRILKGSVKLKVDDLETIARVMGGAVVELVHEQGREYVADLLPLEKALIDLIREDPRYLPVLLEFLRLRNVPGRHPHGVPTPTVTRVSRKEFWAPAAPPSRLLLAGGDDEER